MSLYQSGEDERHRLERMKIERTEHDTQYFKQILATFEKRLEDESIFRAKNEEDNRKFIEAKLQGMFEKLKNEEKNALEREKRLM